jgi:hypothetical protein
VLSFYQSQNVDWIIFGNIPSFSADEKSILSAKLVLMQHGIGGDVVERVGVS